MGCLTFFLLVLKICKLLQQVVVEFNGSFVAIFCETACTFHIYGIHPYIMAQAYAHHALYWYKTFCCKKSLEIFQLFSLFPTVYSVINSTTLTFFNGLVCIRISMWRHYERFNFSCETLLPFPVNYIWSHRLLCFFIL
jgi:hypothetical protein